MAEEGDMRAQRFDGENWVTVGSLEDACASCVDCGTASGWYGPGGDQWEDLYVIEKDGTDG